jgi:hypothetical protein
LNEQTERRTALWNDIVTSNTSKLVNDDDEGLKIAIIKGFAKISVQEFSSMRLAEFY